MTFHIEIAATLKSSGNFFGSSCRTRTNDTLINSQVLYRLS